MALDASVGLLLDEDRSEYSADLLRELNEALQGAGLLPHDEPSSWDEILARHPNQKKKKPRDLGVRLGFYSSPKYEDLRTLASHLEAHRRAPDHWPLHAPMPAPAAPLFAHLRAMLGLGTILLPREFSEVIPGPSHRKEVYQIASAPRVKAEAEVILAACGALDTGDPNQDWKNAAHDERLASWGLQKVRLADPWVTLGEPLDLCMRLVQVAENVVWSGCCAITN